MRAGGAEDGRRCLPEWVVACDELAELTSEPLQATVELIGTHGPAHGVRLLAASGERVQRYAELLAHFPTRFVFQTESEQDSIDLLGQPDAADLKGAGHLLLRVDGREPLAARGIQVSDEHLDRLLELMRTAYGRLRETQPAPEPDSDADSQAVSAPVGWVEAAPARRFLDALAAAIERGDAHCAGQDGQAPRPLEAWGWRTDSDAAWASRRPQGRCVGWVAGDDLYLDPDEAYAVAAREASTTGSPLEQDLTAIQKDLLAGGYLRSTDSARETMRVRRKVGGQRRSVLHLSTAALSGPPAPRVDVQEGEVAGPFGDRRPVAGERVSADAPAATVAVHAETSETTAGLATAPTLEVQCFGGFVVRSGRGELSPRLSEGGQSKATHVGWEALAYLAAHDPSGVPTERLAEAIHPGCREEQATGRLYVTLSRLRAALRSQVPELPGDPVTLERRGLCRLDTTVVRSDVHAFLGLVRAAARATDPQERIAALEQARALYQGDLLGGPGGGYHGWLFEHESEDGVLLPDAYRQQFLRATRELARLCAERGEVPRAVQHYREILQLEPTAEDVVRDLYRCYERLGDLSALLREDQRLRQALREAWTSLDEADEDDAGEDFEPTSDDLSYSEPEQETLALFEQIRGRLSPRVGARQSGMPEVAARVA